MKRFVPMPMLLCALFLLACPPQGQEPAPVDTTADVAAIEALGQAYDEAAAAADAEAAANLFTEDATRMPPEARAEVGRDAIREAHAAAFTGGTTLQRITFHETHVMGDWAASNGTYGVTFTPEGGGEPVSQNGKWITVFRRDPDGWKIYQNVWNTDHEWTPPPAPEEGGQS